MAPKKGPAVKGDPIFVAIDKGQDETVEELLKSDPACKDSRNRGALRAACMGPAADVDRSGLPLSARLSRASRRVWR